MDSKVCHLEPDRDEAFRSQVRVFQHSVVGFYDKNFEGIYKRVPHTESLSFLVLGFESPPILLIFGRNHALMPVTIQVAWVENCLFQHVHFSLREIGPLLNLTWYDNKHAISALLRCFWKVSFEQVNEVDTYEAQYIYMYQAQDIPHQIAGTSSYWKAQLYTVKKLWKPTQPLIGFPHSAQDSTPLKQRWGVVEGDDHVRCDDEPWKPPQSGSLDVMLSYWCEEVTFCIR